MINNTNDPLVNNFLQMTLMLGIVLCIIIVSAYLLRKFLKVRNITSSTAIKLVSVLSFGVKERIILIEANNVTLLVGVTASNITVLHVFSNCKETQ